MPKPLKLSLRTRLLVGIGLGWLLLVAALLTYSHLRGSALTHRENLVHLDYEARLVADQVAREIGERKEMLARLAGDLDVADPRLEARLRDQQPLLAMFDRLMVFDARGEAVAAWPAFAGDGIAHRRYFRFVKALRRAHVSEPYRGAESGTDQIMIIQPLLGKDGEFLGILGGNTSLHDGQAFLNLRGRYLGAAGHILLITAEGQVISHPDETRLREAVDDLEARPLLDRALLGWQGSGEEPTLDGEPALAAFRQIWPAQWVVGVYLPQVEARVPVRRYARELLWVGVGSVALMLPLLWWLLRLGLAPLHRLERQIARVRRGESTQLEMRTGMMELRQVVEAFNRLEARRRETLTTLEAREAFLQSVLASSPVGMFLADPQGHVSYFNPALERLVGLPVEACRPLAWLRRVHPEDRRAFLATWREALRQGGDLHQQYRFHASRDEWRWFEVRASRVARGEDVLGFVGLIQDVTERHERERRHRWEAEHDALTGCLNRRGFLRRLDRACRSRDADGALIMLDLDHFKTVNDTAGHAAGDALLRVVARLLRESVRGDDLVARLGGDEFAILLTSAPLHEVAAIAERIRARLSGVAFAWAGQDFRVSSSVGVALASGGTEAAEAWMVRADQASYRAKQQGRNAVVMAEPATG